MKRTFMMLIICLLPSANLAATLGKPIIQSALGQPLNVKIPISLSEQHLAPDQITARISSQQPNDTIAKEQQPILADLVLTVTQQQHATPYIQINGHKSVNEPFLRLPIEIQWPNGKLQRNYIVFLDPPKSILTATTSSLSTDYANVVNNKRRLYGPTKSHDRLWQIANAYHQNGSTTSIQQLMLAIFLANPHAFTQHDMHALKLGQYLHIPPLYAAAAYSQQQAMLAINKQPIGKTI